MRWVKVITRRGTRITLYLAEDSLEFANEFSVKEDNQ